MPRLPTADEVWAARLSRKLRAATKGGAAGDWCLEDPEIRALLRELTHAVGACREDGLRDGLADEPLRDPRPLAVLDRIGERLGVGPRPR